MHLTSLTLALLLALLVGAAGYETGRLLNVSVFLGMRQLGFEGADLFLMTTTVWLWTRVYDRMVNFFAEIVVCQSGCVERIP